MSRHDRAAVGHLTCTGLGQGPPVSAESREGARRLCNRDPAQALIWLTLLLPLFLGIAGLAIDGAVLLTARRELQSAADGAARAGATEIDIRALRASSGDEVRLDADRATARTNVYLASRLAREVHWHSGPESRVTTTRNAVQVTISGRTPTAFLRALHIDTFPVEATATAAIRHGIDQAIP